VQAAAVVRVLVPLVIPGAHPSKGTLRPSAGISSVIVAASGAPHIK